MNKFDFGKIQSRMRSLDISLDIANVAKNYFVANFANQSFGGVKWKEVNRRISGSKGYKPSQTQNILIGKGSGKLRRDVANSVSDGHKNSNLSYTLIVKNEYASYHNEGTDIIPQRQFVGMTTELNSKLLTKISQKTDTIWGL